MCVEFSLRRQTSVVSCQLVLPEMQLPIGFVPVLIPVEESLGLGFLIDLHSFRYDVREPALADRFQDVLTVELPVHQHIVDMDEILSRVK